MTIDLQLGPKDDSIRRKIAMVAACPFPANRGTPSRILAMANRLSCRRHDITVVTYHLGMKRYACRARVIRTPKLPYRNFTPGPTLTKLIVLNPLLLWRLYQTVRHRGIELIHAHHFEGALIAFIVRRFTGLPVIYDAHTFLGTELPSYPLFYNEPMARYLDLRVPSAADHVITVSDSLKEALVRVGVHSSQIDVIPTGTTVDLFAGVDGDETRRRLKLQGKRIVMYTGTIVNYQGIGDLIDVMEQVVRSNPDAVLLMVGQQYFESFERQVRQRKLEDRILFLGDVPFPQIPELLAAADVVVSPRSECPGIPQKLANYMAAGKAIVSFEGSAALITHNHDGIIVGNHDTKAMADAIHRLFSDPELRLRLQQNALRTVRRHYDWEVLIQKVETVYDRVLRRHRANRRDRTRNGRT